jgi:hypothetical protein
MTEYFNEVGVPVWLPEDFDIRDVTDAAICEISYLDGVKGETIINIEIDHGMEIEKTFKEEEYPAAIESWQWFKNEWAVAHESQMEIVFTPEESG